MLDNSSQERSEGKEFRFAVFFDRRQRESAYRIRRKWGASAPKLGSGATAGRKSEVGRERTKSSKWGTSRSRKFEAGAMAPSEHDRREIGEDWKLGSGASAAKKSEVGDVRGKS